MMQTICSSKQKAGVRQHGPHVAGDAAARSEACELSSTAVHLLLQALLGSCDLCKLLLSTCQALLEAVPGKAHVCKLAAQGCILLLTRLAAGACNASWRLSRCCGGGAAAVGMQAEVSCTAAIFDVVACCVIS